MVRDNFVREILMEYERIRDKNQKELEYRKSQVYEIVPEIKEIDDELGKIGIKLSKAVLLNPENCQKEVEKLKEETKYLKERKARLFKENNIPQDFLELQYDCPKCKDTGFLDGGSKCNCFKQKLIERAYKTSNIAHRLEEENFQKFNIELFSDEKFEDEKLTPRENMLHLINIA